MDNERRKLIIKHGKFVRFELQYLVCIPVWTLIFWLLSKLFSFYKTWCFVIICIILVVFIVTFVIHCIIIPPSMHKQLRAEAKELVRADSTPVSAKLMDMEVVRGTKKSSAVTRGLVGAAIFGTVGAAYGIATAKQKIKEKNAYFLVEYESGRIDTEIVTIGSERFTLLASLVQEE